MELPKDRFGTYLLPDEDGNPQRVQVGFDLRHLAPRLQINGRRVLTAPPLPRAAWLLLLPALILAFSGGVLGAVLGIAAGMLAAQQLRKPTSVWLRALSAVAIEVAAVLIYLGLATLIQML